MFNFFNKKKPTEAKESTKSVPQTDSPNHKKNELIQRWDAFLTKIEERFHTSVAQAKEALLEQLVESDYDYNATMRAWRSMRQKILNIKDQIELIWDTKVEPKMEELDDLHDMESFHIDEGFKGDNLGEKLYELMAIYAIEIEGAIAQKFYTYAVKTIEKDFLCSQCNSPLEIKKDVFRLHYVDCQYCNTTNTYQPDVKYNQIGWFAIDALVELECLEAFKALQAIEVEISDTRPPVSNELITAHEKAYWVYHNKRLDTKIKHKSDEAERRAIDVKQLEDNRLDYIKRNS